MDTRMRLVIKTERFPGRLFIGMVSHSPYPDVAQTQNCDIWQPFYFRGIVFLARDFNYRMYRR
jgi:hypothetical protein